MTILSWVHAQRVATGLSFPEILKLEVWSREQANDFTNIPWGEVFSAARASEQRFMDMQNHMRIQALPMLSVLFRRFRKKTLHVWLIVLMFPLLNIHTNVYVVIGA